MKNKLNSICTRVLILSRILLILLIVISIFPWLFPTSNLGSALLGVFGVPHYVKGDFSEVVNGFTILNRTLGIMGSIIGILPLLIAAVIMIKLSKNYIAGKVFNLDNTKSYTKLGTIYLLSAVILQPFSQVLFSLSATINNPVGQRSIMISFDLSNITTIFFAIILILIGHVMKLAQKISEEQELTV